MKTNSHRATVLVAVAASWVSGLFLSDVQGQTQIQGQAVVRFTSGAASFSSKGGAFRPLKVNTLLTTGDVIKTEANAQVDLFLGRNNGAVQLAPNTVLALERLTYSTAGEEVIHDTGLDLQQGRVYGRVGKMSPQSKYEVKTPRFVAGIKGTRYSISADGMVTVSEGSVLVVVALPPAQPGGQPIIQSYRVDAGNSFDVKAAVGKEVRPATPAETQLLNAQIEELLQQGAQWPLTPVPFVAPEVPLTPSDKPAGSGGTGGETKPPVPPIEPTPPKPPVSPSA